LKVLYIVTAFARKKDDFVTPWLTSTVSLLNEKKNIDVEVLTSSYKGLKSQIINNTKVHRFRYFFKKFEILTHEKCVPEKLKENKIMWLLIPFYMFFGTLATIRLLLKNNYDIIHIHWPFPHFFFTIIPRIFIKFKIVSTFHGTGPIWVKYYIPFLGFLFKLIIRYSDLITVNSSFTKEEILGKIYYGNFKIIPFGAYTTRKNITDSNVKPQKLLFVGRLVKRKGLKYLINAVNLLRDEFPKLSLSIIGGGPEKSALEKMIKESKLEDKIEMLGPLSPDEVSYHYKTCEIFILPSIIDEIGNTETLGVVLIEALSYKKPVIASRVGGIVDIVKDNKTGILVEHKNSHELARAIKNLLLDSNYAKNLGLNGYRYVMKNFSWEKIINDLCNSYYSLINQ
jgi:glycosyltransferase involved in cell wall biosynthesis